MIGIASAGVFGFRAEAGSSINIATQSMSLADHYKFLKEGGIVIDKRPCQKDPNYIIKIVTSPMIDWTLKGVMKREIFNGLSLCMNLDEVKSTDYVSPELYLKLWRKYGAKIGHRKNNQIIWESGEIESIYG